MWVVYQQKKKLIFAKSKKNCFKKFEFTSYQNNCLEIFGKDCHSKLKLRLNWNELIFYLIQQHGIHPRVCCPKDLEKISRKSRSCLTTDSSCPSSTEGFITFSLSILYKSYFALHYQASIPTY